MTRLRSIAVVALSLLIVGLIAFARGRPDHRGPQEVGARALGAVAVVATRSV